MKKKREKTPDEIIESYYKNQKIARRLAIVAFILAILSIILRLI